MWITYATLAIGVGLNLLFIPAFGILGAAYTSLVAHALGNGLAGLWANKQLGFNTFFTVSKT
jgi:O-antigen/teichoic acid export membrane protein